MVAPLWVCQSVSCNQQWRPRRTTAYRTYTMIGPPTHFFFHGQKRDYLSGASQCARRMTKNHDSRNTAAEDSADFDITVHGDGYWPSGMLFKKLHLN